MREYLNSNLDAQYYNKFASVNESWIELKSILKSGQEIFIPHILNNNWKKKNWQFSVNNSFRALIKKKLQLVVKVILRNFGNMLGLRLLPQMVLAILK